MSVHSDKLAAKGADASIVKADGYNLLIGRQRVGTHLFYVKLSTHSRSRIQLVTVIISPPLVSAALAALRNSNPQFESSLPSKLDVNFTRDSDGEIVGDMT